MSHYTVWLAPPKGQSRKAKDFHQNRLHLHLISSSDSDLLSFHLNPVFCVKSRKINPDFLRTRPLPLPLPLPFSFKFSELWKTPFSHVFSLHKLFTWLADWKTWKSQNHLGKKTWLCPFRQHGSSSQETQKPRVLTPHLFLPHLSNHAGEHF